MLGNASSEQAKHPGRVGTPASLASCSTQHFTLSRCSRQPLPGSGKEARSTNGGAGLQLTRSAGQTEVSGRDSMEFIIVVSQNLLKPAGASCWCLRPHLIIKALECKNPNLPCDISLESLAVMSSPFCRISENAICIWHCTHAGPQPLPAASKRVSIILWIRDRAIYHMHISSESPSLHWQANR